jgi:hypothetical protein
MCLKHMCNLTVSINQNYCKRITHNGHDQNYLVQLVTRIFLPKEQDEGAEHEKVTLKET